MKKIIFSFSALVLTAGAAAASGSGAQFLTIGTDARLNGLGGGGAVVGGISALGYNPAGLGELRMPEVTFSHSSWLMDSVHDHVGFGFRALGAGLAVGVTRLSNGSMSGRGEDRGVSGGYNAWDQAVSVGMGYKGMGMAVKYIQSEIAGSRADAFAVDLGVRRAFGRLPATFGVGVRNLGTGIRYISQKDELPVSVEAGVSFVVLPGMGLTADVARLVHEGRTVFSAGSEYAVSAGRGLGFALRGGYGLSELGRSADSGGVSFGGGIAALGAQLDYAVSPQAGLGNTQRITLKKKF